MYLWGLDVVMVNLYLLYKCWMERHKLTPMESYQFRESITLALMDSDNYRKDRYPKRRRLISVSLPGKGKDQLTAGSISSISS